MIDPNAESRDEHSIINYAYAPDEQGCDPQDKADDEYHEWVREIEERDCDHEIINRDGSCEGCGLEAHQLPTWMDNLGGRVVLFDE